ncbi:MAG: ABC transporter ATP-binding protein [Mycoplasma sp.]|nr:ABC transporter ATP-binding protein [Mycoplasma sp.]
MKNENYLVKLENINKHYGEKHVLKDINMLIKKGDRLAFIGGNGSGKSTTVEIIAGIRKASSGKIFLSDDLIIGMQFQESNYPIGVTVSALINFYIENSNIDISKEELNKLLTLFRLDDLLKKQIITMSGGQQQRLNILLALVHEPNLLILDELSTGLDIKIRRDLRSYIKEYLEKKPECALILITHSMDEVEDLSDKVIVLDFGVITHEMKTTDIMKKYGSVSKFANSLFEDMYDHADNKKKEGKK